MMDYLEARQAVDQQWLARHDAASLLKKQEAERLLAAGVDKQGSQFRCRVTDSKYRVHEGLIYSVSSTYDARFDLYYLGVARILVPGLPGQFGGAEMVPTRYLEPLNKALIELSEVDKQIGAGI